VGDYLYGEGGEREKDVADGEISKAKLRRKGDFKGDLGMGGSG